MVKIKRKVEMILPELIEWGFKQKELLPFFMEVEKGHLCNSHLMVG